MRHLRTPTRIRHLLFLALILAALAGIMAQGCGAVQGNLQAQREQVLITVDMLRPLDPGAEEFATAQSLVEADVNALFDELSADRPRAQVLAQDFDRLERSLALLGDEAGYTNPYVQNITGKRSLDSYRELLQYFAQLREETLGAPGLGPGAKPAVQGSAEQPSGTQTPSPLPIRPAPSNATDDGRAQPASAPPPAAAPAPAQGASWWERAVARLAVLARRLS